MYVDMACIVMYDNISIARSKRVNEKIVLCYTVQEEDQFPCKSSGLWFTWIISYDRYGIVRTHNRLFYKGLTNKLHAYALVRKKLVYMQSFRFIGAMVSEFGFFKKKKLF